MGGQPSTIKPAQILALQRTVGNKVVQRMLGERKQQSDPDAQANISPSGDLVQRHPEDTAKIGSLKESINQNSTVFGDALISHKSKIENLTDATNDNFGIFHDALTGHKELLNQHGGRLSNLESSGGGSGGGGEEGSTGEGGSSSRSRNRTSAPPA